MSIRRDDAPLTSGIRAVRQHEACSGGHSWGYAVSDGTQLKIHTDLGEIDELHAAPRAEAALVHTRMATCGDITLDNAHPFFVTWDGDVRRSSVDVQQQQFGKPDARTAALAHNGTWHEAPADEEHSDTYYIARDFETRLRKGVSVRDAVEATGAKTGETFIVLTDTGRCLVYPGRFPIERRGDVVQSSDIGHELYDVVEL